MKRKLIAVLLFLLFFLCIVVLCACSSGQKGSVSESSKNITSSDGYSAYVLDFSNDNSTVRFYRQIASHMDDETGWYFQFCREGMKDDLADYVYTLLAINLRYRYGEDYWRVSYQQDIHRDGTPAYWRIKTKPGLLWFADGNEDQKKDSRIAAGLIVPARDPEVLLAEDPNQYEFKVLDKDMYFTMIREALTNPPIPEGPYWETSIYAMDVEPDYLDGYKFQIAWALRNGFIDEIYIDVLYKTGTEYNDYEQLSDLVEKGRAETEQKEAFELIRQIRQTIKEKGSFVAMDESYKDKEIGGVDFYRLYTFLHAIESNDDLEYDSINENQPWIMEEISKEEFDEATKQNYK